MTAENDVVVLISFCCTFVKMLQNSKRYFYRNGVTIMGLISGADKMLETFGEKMNDSSLMGTFKTAKRSGDKIQDFVNLKILRDLLESLWTLPNIEISSRRTIAEIAQETAQVLGIPITQIIEDSKKEKEGLKALNPSASNTDINAAAMENVLFTLIVNGMFPYIEKYGKGYAISKQETLRRGIKSSAMMDPMEGGRKRRRKSSRRASSKKSRKGSSTKRRRSLSYKRKRSSSKKTRKRSTNRRRKRTY